MKKSILFLVVICFSILLTSCTSGIALRKQIFDESHFQTKAVDESATESDNQKMPDEGNLYASANTGVAGAETHYQRHSTQLPNEKPTSQAYTNKPTNIKIAEPSHNKRISTNKPIRGKIKKALHIQKQIKEEGKKTDPFALTSMILGIASLFLILLPITNIAFLSLASAILAIIFGIIGLKNIRKNPDTLKGKGFGITGLVTGILFVVIVSLLIIALVSA